MMRKLKKMKTISLALAAVVLLAGSASAYMEAHLAPKDAYSSENVTIRGDLVTDFPSDGEVWWNYGEEEESVDWFDVSITYSRAGVGQAVGAYRSILDRAPIDGDDLAFPPTSDDPDDWSVFKTVTFNDLRLYEGGVFTITPEACGASDRFIDIKEVVIKTSDGEPSARARAYMLSRLAGEWHAEGELIDQEGLPKKIVIDERGGYVSYGADGSATQKGTLGFFRSYEMSSLITVGMDHDGQSSPYDEFVLDRPGRIHFGTDSGLEYSSGFETDERALASAFAKLAGRWVAEGEGYRWAEWPRSFEFDSTGGFKAKGDDGSVMMENGRIKLHAGETDLFQFWQTSWSIAGQGDFTVNDGTIDVLGCDELIYKKER